MVVAVTASMVQATPSKVLLMVSVLVMPSVMKLTPPPSVRVFVSLITGVWEPVNTAVAWSYDENSAVLRTEYTTSVAIHEGSGTTVIQGLLPHQWAHLAADAPALTGVSLSSIRGELKMLLPIGLVYDLSDQVRLDPDQQVQETLRLFFRTFERTGSATGTRSNGAP